MVRPVTITSRLPVQETAYYRRVVKDNNCLAEKITYVVEVFAVDYVPLNGGNLTGPKCVFLGDYPGNIKTGDIKVSGGLATLSVPMGEQREQWQFYGYTRRCL